MDLIKKYFEDDQPGVDFYRVQELYLNLRTHYPGTDACDAYRYALQIAIAQMKAAEKEESHED